MEPTTTNLSPTGPGGQRNAPGVNTRLSQCVDVLSAAVEEARAAGLHRIADELVTARDRVATLALDLWKREGCE